MKLTRMPRPAFREDTPLDGDELYEPVIPHKIERFFTKFREPEPDIVRTYRKDE